MLGRDVADADAFDFIELNGNAHKDDYERGNFYGGIPGVEIVGGIRLSYADLLGFFYSFFEGEAALHFGEDNIGGGIQQAAKTTQFDGRKRVRKEGENRSAVHHRGFEEEFSRVGVREIAKFSIGVNDGAFVGADGVGAGFERGFQVVNGGVAAVAVERGGFEKDVGARGAEPVADVVRRFPCRRRGKAILKQCVGIEAGGIGDPSEAA